MCVREKERERDRERDRQRERERERERQKERERDRQKERERQIDRGIGEESSSGDKVGNRFIKWKKCVLTNYIKMKVVDQLILMKSVL